MQSTSQPSRQHQKQHLFASSVLDPRKSILPIFDDDNDLSSEPRLSYIIDFDLPDFDTRLIPSPQFHAVVNGLYLEKTKASTSPRPSIESLMPPRPLGTHAVDTKHQSFLELEADCSALQLDSEVIVLTRPRTMSKLPSAYLHSPFPAPPPSSRAPSPAPSAMRVQVRQQQPVQLSDPIPPRGGGGIGGGYRYQRKAPPQLQLKTSNYRRLSRRISTQLQLGDTAAYFVPHPAASLRAPSLTSVPSPQQSVLSHARTMTPISIKSFRFSYASSSRCVGGGGASKIQFSTKELHRRRILKLQRTFGERVPLELVTVSPRRRRPTSRPLSIVSYRAPAVFYPPFDGHANGTPMSGIVRDWTFDQIAPPASTGGGLQSALNLAVVSRQTTKGVQNALRKSQMMLKRVDSASGGASPSLPQVEEHADEDHGDNSIWLDEAEPSPPRQRKRTTARASGLLVFVNKNQNQNQNQKRFTASRMAEVQYDDGQVVHPVHATSVSVSRPVSSQNKHYRQRSSMVLAGPSRLGASSAQAQAQAGPSRLAISTSAPFDVDAAFPEGCESYCDSPSASRSSSPSMPAFRNAYEVEDSDDNSDLHHHPLDVAIDLSPGSTPSQGASVPPPKAGAATGTGTGTGQHSVRHTPSNSYASDGYAYGYQQAGGFLDVPEKIPSATRRRERRQGWSGEWNQPTIKDVIQKLRDI